MDAALDDLREAVQHIAFDAPRGARDFGLRVFETAATLADFPNRHAAVRVVAGLPLRHLVISNYLLWYSVASDVVEIIAFQRGEREWQTLLELILRRIDQD